MSLGVGGVAAVVLLLTLSGTAGALTLSPASTSGAVVAVLLALVMVGVGGRVWRRFTALAAVPVTNARPAASGARHLKIDFLRGLATVFVVVDHIELPSLYHLISHERLGVVSGAELFVVLSGVVLGLVFRRRGRVDRVLARARLLYGVAVSVALGAYLISRIPGGDGAVLTTWTDRATGTVFPLYSGAQDPLHFLAGVLLLQSGPWQFNIMGLYVVLLLLAPVALRGLGRGQVLQVLAVSWALYLIQTLSPGKRLPLSFDEPFRLLAWQLLFVHGLALGYFRQEVLAWLRTRPGRMLGGAAVVVFAGLLFFSWNSPWSEGAFDRRLSLIPASTFWDVYTRWFDRAQLGPGRVLNVAALLLVAYALLGRFWPFFQRTLGWLLVPLGQVTLYVFILHVFFVYLVASLPFLQGRSVGVNTVVHTLVLLALWGLVKGRVLFGWIPR